MFQINKKSYNHKEHNNFRIPYRKEQKDVKNLKIRIIPRQTRRD